MKHIKWEETHYDEDNDSMKAKEEVRMRRKGLGGRGVDAGEAVAVKMQRRK